MHIQKEKKNMYCGLFFKRCSFKIRNHSYSRMSKIQNFRTHFQIVHKEISLIKSFCKSSDSIALPINLHKEGLTSFNSCKDLCSQFRTKGKEILNPIKGKITCHLIKLQNLVLRNFDVTTTGCYFFLL